MSNAGSFRVAAVQMASGASVGANLDEAAEHIAAARAEGAALVALPEFFAFMGKGETDILGIAEAPGGGPIQDFLATQARRYGVWLVGGTIPLRAETPEKVRAACLLFDASGELAARYDKIHLFDVTVEGDSKKVYRESRTVEPGTETRVVDSPFGRLGLAVCYDLRFPELFRVMTRDGMQVLILPSAFTAVTGKAHWEVLLRARAIENLCYVVAPAQGGRHPSGRETYGDSLIVDPWGSVLARREKGNGIVFHDIDAGGTERLRRGFPALDHIRFAIEAP